LFSTRFYYFPFTTVANTVKKTDGLTANWQNSKIARLSERVLDKIAPVFFSIKGVLFVFAFNFHEKTSRKHQSFACYNYVKQRKSWVSTGSSGVQFEHMIFFNSLPVKYISSSLSTINLPNGIFMNPF